MTTKTVYRCDFCNKEFEDENECLNHEKIHVEVDEIMSASYFTTSAYADEVEIKMKDGKEFTYVRRNC